LEPAYILKSDGTLFKYERDKDVLQKYGGGSWTIKQEILEENGNVIKRIQYVTETKVYTIELSKALVKGWEMKFQGVRKLVVPLKQWDAKPITI
jgi:hypothetical protein